jgi:AcrR family transcriptional regulator
MLREAARLFAERGFHGTSTEDIGSACGISGPAVYKHFPSKRALLARMLLDISRQLVEGGRMVVEEAPDAASALEGLIAFHTGFAINEPDLIRVQDRDLESLDPSESRRVRRLQREYLEIWVGILQRLEPTLPADVGRIRAHAVFGLLNSTPHSGGGRATRAELIRMARRALRAT